VPMYPRAPLNIILPATHRVKSDLSVGLGQARAVTGEAAGIDKARSS
jgi:hypothetical protein